MFLVCYLFCFVLTVLAKRGKLITFLRMFFSNRPQRSTLKQNGIVKERVYGCDLGEHLSNSSLNGEMMINYDKLYVNFWTSKSSVNSSKCTCTIYILYMCVYTLMVVPLRPVILRKI